MLLDYGSSWLGEYRDVAAATVFPGSGGTAILPEFLFLLLALQSDSQKALYFGLLLFALQGFQNIRVGVMVEF